MSETIEQKCIAKGVKLTDQRRIIAKVMGESQDHPDVDELYNRVSKIDSKISIATVFIVSKHLEIGYDTLEWCEILVYLGKVED